MRVILVFSVCLLLNLVSSAAMSGQMLQHHSMPVTTAAAGETPCHGESLLPEQGAGIMDLATEHIASPCCEQDCSGCLHLSPGLASLVVLRSLISHIAAPVQMMPALFSQFPERRYRPPIAV